MRERPILFSGPMIRAILAGQKTQTRRVMKPQPEHVWGFGVKFNEHDFTAHVRYPGMHPPDPWVRCPYGAPPHRGESGDRLWIRETWGSADRYYQGHENDTANVVAYAADKQAIQWNAPAPRAVPSWDIAQWNWDVMKWKPSIHMPRAFSRITLDITAVRVERVQDISEEDAKAEGVTRLNTGEGWGIRRFAELWNEINARKGYSWEANPWVWVIAFRRVGSAVA